jgi:hypothetical protein
MQTLFLLTLLGMLLLIGWCLMAINPRDND